MMGYDGALLGKPFHMLRLFFEKGQGDEERKICIFNAGLFEHIVEASHDILPQCISPRLDHHATANGRAFGQIRSFDGILVPFRIIFLSCRCNRCFFLFCHVVAPIIKKFNSNIRVSLIYFCCHSVPCGRLLLKEPPPVFPRETSGRPFLF